MKKLMIVAIVIMASTNLKAQPLIVESQVNEEELSFLLPDTLCHGDENIMLISFVYEGTKSIENISFTGTGVMSDGSFHPSVIENGENITIILKYLEDGESKLITKNVIIYYRTPVSIGWVPKEIKAKTKPYEITGYPAGGKWYCDGKKFEGNFDPSKSEGITEILYLFTDKNGCSSSALEQIKIIRWFI